MVFLGPLCLQIPMQRPTYGSVLHNIDKNGLLSNVLGRIITLLKHINYHTKNHRYHQETPDDGGDFQSN